MPAWMVEGRSRPKKYSSEELAWMDLFESGEGFRVRLKPGISAEINDTFSWLQRKASTIFQVSSNRLGFRSTEFAQKKTANTTRLVLFGDSSSFGWGVNQDENYLNLLADDLRKDYPRRTIEALNFSMPGDSSEFGRLIFDKFLQDLTPDIVLIGFGANDARLASVPHSVMADNYKAHAGLQRIRTVLLRHSAIARVLEKITKGHPAEAVPMPTRGIAVKPRRFRTNLTHFIEQSRAVSAKQTVLVSLCSPFEYAKVMQKTAKAHGALFLNGQLILRRSIEKLRSKKIYPEYTTKMQKAFGSLLKKEDLLYITSDGCHPNAVGHRIIADALYQELTEIGGL
ncbi:MAG: hypothetical protein KDD42_05050 [Bdellovibrionales bacterium]|nr:hypothetical protein [Bdellovibrionales bacterium]